MYSFLRNKIANKIKEQGNNLKIPPGLKLFWKWLILPGRDIVVIKDEYISWPRKQR